MKIAFFSSLLMDMDNEFDRKISYRPLIDRGFACFVMEFLGRSKAMC